MKYLSSLKKWVLYIVSILTGAFKKDIEEMMGEKISSLDIKISENLNKRDASWEEIVTRLINKKFTPEVVAKINDPNLHTSPSKKVSIRFENGSGIGGVDAKSCSVDVSLLEKDETIETVPNTNNIRIYNAGTKTPTYFMKSAGSESETNDSLSFDTFAFNLMKSIPGIAKVSMADVYTLYIYKSPAASWEKLRPQIEEQLFNYLEEKLAKEITTLEGKTE